MATACGSYFYLVREIALAESSRETRKIYPRYFALSPAYPALPPLPPPYPSVLAPHPALFIRRVSFSLLLRPCPPFSRFSVRALFRALSLLFGQGQGGKRRRLSTRERSLLSRRGRIRVFERHQRDMLMPVGAMKSWPAESRISIKAIEATM